MCEWKLLFYWHIVCKLLLEVRKCWYYLCVLFFNWMWFGLVSKANYRPKVSSEQFTQSLHIIRHSEKLNIWKCTFIASVISKNFALTKIKSKDCNNKFHNLFLRSWIFCCWWCLHHMWNCCHGHRLRDGAFKFCTYFNHAPQVSSSLLYIFLSFNRYFWQFMNLYAIKYSY